jgi:hypothetical protein
MARVSFGVKNSICKVEQSFDSVRLWRAAERCTAQCERRGQVMRYSNMRNLWRSGMRRVLAARWQKTGGRSDGGGGAAGRTEIKIKSKSRNRETLRRIWRSSLRLREKHVADLADQKKTLEITGLFCRKQVRHVADLERRTEARGQRAKGGMKIAKCKMKNANWLSCELRGSDLGAQEGRDSTGSLQEPTASDRRWRRSCFQRESRRPDAVP